METRARDRYKVYFIAILLVVLFVSCVLIGSVYSWLKWETTRDSTGLQVGTVDIEIYANGSRVDFTNNHKNGSTWECASPYTIPTSTTTTRTLNLKVRNVGTVDALVRATIRVYSVSNNNSITYLIGDPGVIVSSAVKINMNTTGWYRDLAGNDQVASGYLYLNNKLEPYTLNGSTNTNGEVSIISQIVVPDTYKAEAMYVSVTIDAVSYSGNIYKKVYENSASNVAVSVNTEGNTNKTYSKFTAPSGFIKDTYPNGTTNLIPVNAYPFTDVIPCDLSGSTNTGWLAWL